MNIQIITNLICSYDDSVPFGVNTSMRPNLNSDLNLDIIGETKNFFHKLRSNVNSLTLVALYEQFRRGDPNRYLLFCKTINIFNKWNNNPTTNNPIICETICLHMTNYKVKFVDGKERNIPKELLEIIPTCQILLSDIDNEEEHFLFPFECSENEFDIIIRYLFGYYIDDEITPMNIFRMLELSELLLVPRIIEVFLRCLCQVQIMTYFTQIDNFDINKLIRLSILLLDLKDNAEKNILPLNIYKINHTFDMYSSKIYTTIKNNPQYFNQSIFVFENWVHFFSESIQEDAIKSLKMYEQLNKSTISPKKILNILSSLDNTTNRYNKIIKRFKWCSPEVYFHPDGYDFSTIPTNIDTICIITSYYPVFKYTKIEKVKYKLLEKMNERSIRIELQYSVSKSKLYSSNKVIFGNHLSSQDMENQRFIQMFRALEKRYSSTLTTPNYVLFFHKPISEFMVESELMTEFSQSMWMVNHYEHEVTIENGNGDKL